MHHLLLVVVSLEVIQNVGYLRDPLGFDLALTPDQGVLYPIHSELTPVHMASLPTYLGRPLRCLVLGLLTLGLAGAHICILHFGTE
jgi:hypothetical protein